MVKKMSSQTLPRFITIPFSHYCEKARWAMDRRGFAYREEPHVPGFHRIITRPLKARGSVPVLLDGGQLFDDSTDILCHVDKQGTAGEPLVPQKDPERNLCLALEERFDQALGPHTRRLMYYHLLQDRQATLQLLRIAGANWEKALLPWVFPVLRTVMQRTMRIDAEGALRSRQAIDTIFSEVAMRLQDGKPYLCGDFFSAADLTFAALAAPVVWPDEYGGGKLALPKLSEFPTSAKKLIEEFRATQAGAFVLRLYREVRLQREAEKSYPA